MTVAAIALGLVACVPVWAVGRWVTRYDHPEDHNCIAWNMLAGVMCLGTLSVVGVMVWGVGRCLIAWLFCR